jgi:hypothetical protein
MRFDHIGKIFTQQISALMSVDINITCLLQGAVNYQVPRHVFSVT